MTLGFYANFPETIHKTTSFYTPLSTKKLQHALIQALHKINGKTFNIEDLADPSIPHCTVTLELGIAENQDFNYLNNEESGKILRAIQKNTLQVLDFFCDLRYYKTQDEKKKPLRFDYYLTRFIFNKNTVEIQIAHERGPRYLTPEDISNLAVNEINESFSKKMLKELTPP